MDNLKLKFENLNFSSTDAIGESLPVSIRREKAKTPTGMRSRKKTKPYDRPTGMLINRTIEILNTQYSEGKIVFNSSVIKVIQNTVMRLLGGEATLSLNVKNNDGNTLLHFSINGHSKNIVKMLLNSGILSLNMRIHDGNTLLNCTTNVNRQSLANIMLLGTDILSLNVSNHDSNKPPHCAMKGKNLEILQACDDSHIHLNVVDNSGDTLLRCDTEINSLKSSMSLLTIEEGHSSE